MSFKILVPVRMIDQVVPVPKVFFASRTLIRSCLYHQASQELWNWRVLTLTSLGPLMVLKAFKLRAMLGAVGATEVAAFGSLFRW